MSKKAFLSHKPSRRSFIKKSSIVGATLLLTACAPAVATEQAATTAPEAAEAEEPAAAEPTEAVVEEAAEVAAEPTEEIVVEGASEIPYGEVDWSIYPEDDPRHFIAYKQVDPVKYDNLEISINHVSWGAPLKENETYDNNVTTRFIEETMGIKFNMKWVGADTSSQWATAFAAVDLPEVMIEMPQTYYLQLLEADMLEDIKEIYEKTASPLTKKYQLYPDAPAWKFCLHNGTYYSMPGNYGPPLSTSDAMWIRQDWLDQVGMKVPETLDEVAEVAHAFIDAGLATVGITMGGGFSGGAVWGGPACVYIAYGHFPGQWKIGPEGMFYTSTDPGQKEALALLQKWYKEGLMETDVAKRSADAMVAFSETFGAGKSGIAFEPYWMGSYGMGGMMTEHPDWKITWHDVPAGPTGKRGFYVGTNTGSISAFLKGTDPQKIEAIINQLNFMTAIMDASRVGERPRYKGYDYDLDADGNYVVGSYSTDYVKPGGWEECFMGSDWWVGEQYKRHNALIEKDPEGKTYNPIEKFLLNDPTGVFAWSRGIFLRITEKLDEWGYRTDFVWPTPAEAQELFPTLNKREQEVYTQIATDQLPVDAWDEWVAEWKSTGGDQVTEMMNKVYQEKTQGG